MALRLFKFSEVKIYSPEQQKLVDMMQLGRYKALANTLYKRIKEINEFINNHDPKISPQLIASKRQLLRELNKQLSDLEDKINTARKGE